MQEGGISVFIEQADFYPHIYKSSQVKESFMKRKISIVLMVGLVVSLCAFTTLARGEEQKAQLMVTYEVVVNPPKFLEYEASLKEFKVLWTKQKFPLPYDVYKTDDYYYYFFVPVENLGDIDIIYSSMEKAGKELQEHTKRYAGTYESETGGTFINRPDLSYAPEKPRIKEEDVNFMRWYYYYLYPGKELAAEEIAKEWMALYKSKGIRDPFNLAVAQLWSGLPLLVVAMWGESEADFTQQDEKNMKRMGDQALVLQKKTMSVCRKIEVRSATYLPDLSYMPEEK